jgi:hypothetical protein
VGSTSQIIVISGRAFVGNPDIGYTPADDGVYNLYGKSDIRTTAQNRALHLWFRLVSDALTEVGADIKTTIKADVMWTPDAVKELIWRPVQKAVTGKKTTTALKKEDIDPIVTSINKILGERFGVTVPFPSMDKK